MRVTESIIECCIKENASEEMWRFAEQNFSDRQVKQIERVLEEVCP